LNNIVLNESGVRSPFVMLVSFMVLIICMNIVGSYTNEMNKQQ